MAAKIARDDNTAQDLREAAGGVKDCKGARRPLRVAPWPGRRCVIAARNGAAFSVATTTSSTNAQTHGTSSRMIPGG